MEIEQLIAVYVVIIITFLIGYIAGSINVKTKKIDLPPPPIFNNDDFYKRADFFIAHLQENMEGIEKEIPPKFYKK